MSDGRTEAPLVVLAPLAIEARALRRALPGVEVIRTGMGPERATRAAARLASRRTRSGAVAVAGFAGALEATLRPGDVVVATEIRTSDGRTFACSSGPLAAGLARLGLKPHVGPIASTDHLVTGSEREALAATGALAVDMESGWLAEAAGGHPFAVLRVIVDTAGRELRRPFATAAGGLTAYRTLRRAAPALESWARAAGPRTVVLAGPRSFCAGVERAIEIVERALDRFGPPVYVRKQIVHNVHVVQDLERRGAVFVDELDQVPEGALTVFSAHGVSPGVRRAAERRKLRVIDATCPLVTKVHAEARRFAKGDYSIVLIGHAGHEEVEGTTGEAPQSIRLIGSADEVNGLEVDDHRPVAYLTQTTLAVDEVKDVVDALRARYPSLAGPGSDDICYATSNRQDAVRAIAGECDLVLVIGSRNSSNSRRLVEVAERAGGTARLIDDDTELDPEWLAGASAVGVTAGASAPESLVHRVVDALASLGPVTVRERTVVDEAVQFTLPVGLRGS